VETAARRDEPVDTAALRCPPVNFAAGVGAYSVIQTTSSSGNTMFFILRCDLGSSAFACCLAVAAAMLSGCDSGPGFATYPVRGVVLVNDQPAENVVVRFHNMDPAIEGNRSSPAGRTDAAGRFELATATNANGAAPGSYKVTFAWMTSNDLSGRDRFRGGFSDPEKSKFDCTISESENDLEPFEIKWPGK